MKKSDEPINASAITDKDHRVAIQNEDGIPVAWSTQHRNGCRLGADVGPQTITRAEYLARQEDQS